MVTTQTTKDKWERAKVPRYALMPIKLSTWWVPGQDLSEYTSNFQRDEARKLEIISERLAKGGLDKPDKILRLAHRIGCTSRFILKVMATKDMQNRVKEMIQMRAVYGTAQALGSQIENSKKDVIAFKTIAQMGKTLESGSGAKAQVNVTIDRRNGGDTISATQFIDRFRERGRQRLVKGLEKAELVSPEEISESEPDS